MDMNNEMDKTAQALAKSSAIDNVTPDLLKATIKDLGITGLRAIIPNLNDSQKTLLKSLLEDMKKASNSLDMPKNADINPERKSAVQGDADEKLYAEAKKKGQDEVKHQGDDSVQSGQVIKSDAKPASGKPETEADKAKAKVPEIEKAESGLDMSEKLETKKEKKETKAHEAKESSAEENKEHMHLMEKSAEVLEKPPVSQAQRAAMHAAAEGHSTLDIPKKVGKEFADADEGGKLPEHKKVKKSDGDADYNVDGDRAMQNPTNGTKRESEAPQSTDEKKESEKEPIMSIEDKKAAAKTNLHKMLSRMQERGMEKSKCISALAKSLDVAEAKIAPLWDLVKAECKCEKCATPEKDQVKPAPIMVEEKKPAKKEPMSGHAHETADEGQQAPAIQKSTVETVEEVGKEGKKGGKVIDHRAEGGMPVYASERETKEEKGEEPKAVKKSDSFFYEDAEFYTPKTENPFNHRTHGQNVTYSVDSFIEEASNAQVSALAKSNFMYHGQNHPKLATSVDDMIAQGVDRDILFEDVEVVTIQKSNAMLVKSFTDEELDSEVCGIDMWGVPMRKSEAGKEAMQNAAQNQAHEAAESKKKEDQEVRDAAVDAKLALIDEHSGKHTIGKKDI